MFAWSRAKAGSSEVIPADSLYRKTVLPSGASDLEEHETTEKTTVNKNSATATFRIIKC
jgi:hypothetical protein